MTWLAYSALGVPKKVVLTTQPSGATAGQALTVQPAGKLVDGSGVLARTSGTEITASKYSGTGTLSGDVTQGTVEGLFTFTDLSMNTVTSAVVLEFRAAALASALSNSFNVIGLTNYSLAALAGAYTVTGTPTSLSYGSTEGTLLFAEGFESGSLGANGWFDDTSVPVIADARPGSSGSNALSMVWNEAAVTPTGIAACRVDFAPSTSLYLSYWVKHSTNWVGSGHTYHPHVFLVTTDVDDHFIGPSQTHLTLYDEFLYTTGGMIHQMSLQDSLNIDTANLGVDLTAISEDRSIGGYNGQPESGFIWDTYSLGGGEYYNAKILRSPSLVITDANKNDWHHIESYWQMNTIVGGIGQPNGVMRLWVDDAIIHDRTDIYFRTNKNPTMKFRTFMVAPYIQDGSPVSQYMRIDDLELRTAPPPGSDYSIVASPASFALTGSTASLTYDGNAILPISAGSYTMSGQAVTLSYTSLGIPELPSGLTLYASYPVMPLASSGWGYNNRNGTATYVANPVPELDLFYPTGFVSGNEPSVHYRSPGASRIFLTYEAKYSSGFTGEPSQVNKHCFLFGSSSGVIFYTESRFSGAASTGAFDVQFQDASTTPNNSQRLGTNFGSEITINNAQWNRHSVFWDRTNNTFKGWSNGTLYGTVTGMNTQSSGEFQIAATWGGNTGATVPSPGQHLYIRNLQIWTG